MEKLKQAKDILLGSVCSQLGNLEKVNAEELGQVVDMVKDLEEAMYYHTITEAMHEKDKNTEFASTYDRGYRNVNRGNGRMFYYDGRNDYENEWTSKGIMGEMREDPREGHSGRYRRMYMESKENHMDKTKKLQDLDNYLQELSADIVEMMNDASPEEKQLLQKKISGLAQKIV